MRAARPRGQQNRVTASCRDPCSGVGSQAAEVQQQRRSSFQHAALHFLRLWHSRPPPSNSPQQQKWSARRRTRRPNQWCARSHDPLQSAPAGQAVVVSECVWCAPQQHRSCTIHDWWRLRQARSECAVCVELRREYPSCQTSCGIWGSVAAVWRHFMRWIDSMDRCCRATGHTPVVRATSAERPRPVRRRLDVT